MTVSGSLLFAGAAPTASDLVDLLRDEFGEGVSSTVVEVPGKGPVDAVVVSTGAVTALIAANDSPVDTVAALRACHPVWWQGETAPVENHRSHVIITVLHPGERPEPRQEAINEATLFSVVATRLAAADAAVAVHVTPAGIVLPADAYARAFTAAVASRQVPAELWTSVWLIAEADGSHSAYTLGLDAFGHRDVVVEHSLRPASDLFRFVAEVARHVLTTGAVLEPGHTVGPSADDQRPLRERHSAIHDALVLEIGDAPAAR